ncbi:unnamed protein product [Haemonchus placei]|uniref:CCHC-type domain-containing protein n=1 Tax=Haemonchus placei TaxID=6290 RepID=A0A0N4XAU3_HAEPC|nr:unnamed protein product [Haemonchus placei]
MNSITLSHKPAQFHHGLRTRDLHTDSLVVARQLIRTADEYLQTSTLDRRLQEEARRASSHTGRAVQRPLRTMTIPHMGPGECTPRSQSAAELRVSPEAGRESTLSSRVGGEHSGLGKRRHNTDDTMRGTEPPSMRPRYDPRPGPVTHSLSQRSVEHAPTQPNTYFRFLVCCAPPEDIEACVFCGSEAHFSTDCDHYPYLSDGAHRAESFGICCNCIKQHYGSCIARTWTCTWTRILQGPLEHMQAGRPPQVILYP